MSHASDQQSWWARGLIFENCNCQLVCPGHMHFEQLCTHERCQGYWAFDFDAGQVDRSSLSGARVVIAYDAPRRMVDGGWAQSLLVDESMSPDQVVACERLFSGAIGGPWAVLSRFVAHRLPTTRAAIELAHEPLSQRVGVAGIMTSLVSAIRGRQRDEPVRFENIFNQIHAPSQVLARGDAHYDDGVIRFDNAGTHGLWSSFEWRG